MFICSHSKKYQEETDQYPAVVTWFAESATEVARLLEKDPDACIIDLRDLPRITQAEVKLK